MRQLIGSCLVLVFLCAPAAHAAEGPADELAARFPSEIEGQPLEVDAASGVEWIGQRDPDDPDEAFLVRRAEELVERVGRQIDDLTIATAIHQPLLGDPSTITAVRVEDVNATNLVWPVMRFLLSNIREPVMRWQAAGETWGIIVRDDSMPGSYPVALVPIGDTMWVVQADRPLRDEIIAGLPPQPPLRQPVAPTERIEIAELGLGLSIPAEWEVQTLLEPMDAPSVIGDPDVRAWRVLALSEGYPEDEAQSDIFAVRGSADPDFCSLSLYAPATLSPEAYLKRLIGDEQQDVTLEEHEGFVRLPAGRGSFFGADVFMELYVFGDGEALAEMWCMGEMPPADRWLPLAESVELLPVERGQRGVGLPGPEPAPPTEPPTVEVPDLRGMSLENAEAMAADHGLVVRADPVPTDEFEAGTVVDQDPGPGEPVDEGSTIDLEIAVE